MNLTENEKEKIEQLFISIDKMIDGRFILSDIKVANVLKAIAGSELLYGFFAKILVGFDFKREYYNSLATNKSNGGYFKMPEDEQKIVAYVFCFLLDVDNGKINLQNFINDNFYNADGYNLSYSNFALVMLQPFKNSVKLLLNIDSNGNINDDAESENEENTNNQLSIEDECKKAESKQSIKILFANIMKSISGLQLGVAKAYKLKNETREELMILLKALKEAVRLENFIIINGLIIPLKTMTVKDRALKELYNELEDHLINFYSKRKQRL